MRACVYMWAYSKWWNVLDESANRTASLMCTRIRELAKTKRRRKLDYCRIVAKSNRWRIVDWLGRASTMADINGLIFRATKAAGLLTIDGPGRVRARSPAHAFNSSVIRTYGSLRAEHFVRKTLQPWNSNEHLGKLFYSVVHVILWRVIIKTKSVLAYIVVQILFFNVLSSRVSRRNINIKYKCTPL